MMIPLFLRRLPALCAALAALPAVSAADAFVAIPAAHPVAAFALTEDGAWLVLAQRDDNLLSIWDVRKGALVKDIPFPGPAHLLCRGPSLFVAGASGKLAVFTVGAWTQDVGIETGAVTVLGLSAAKGSHFAGHLLVSGHDGGAAHIVDVDAATGQHREIMHGPGTVVAAVSADGAAVVVPMKDPVDRLASFPMAMVATGKITCGASYAPVYLTQERDCGLWIGHDGIHLGDGLTRVMLDADQAMVGGPPTGYAAMDALCDRVYVVHDGHIDARALEVGLPVVDGWDCARPASAAHASWQARTPANAQAATVDGITHVFIEGDPGVVMVADHQAATNAAPAPNDGFPTVAVIGQPVACTLAPAGDFRVLAGPPGLAIAADGTVQWTPVAAEIGSHHLKIRAAAAVGPGAGSGGVRILRPSCTVVVPTAAGLAGRALSDVFTPLPCRDAVSDFILTDDGRWLVLAHRLAGKLSIWDVDRQAMTQVIACPAPSAMVARKGNLYVANQGAGTISVLSIGDWVPGPPLNFPEGEVVSLGAAGGKWFDGKLFVTTKDTGFLVDLASGARMKVPVSGWSSIAWNGETIISHQNGRTGAIQVYHPADQAPQLDSDDAPLLTQCNAGGMWVGGNAIWQGDTPHPAAFTQADPARMWPAPRQQVAMDLAAQVIYRVCEDHVDAYGMNLALPKLGTWQTTSPQVPMPQDDDANHDWAATAAPQAVTSDGVTHLFILGNQPGVVLTASLPGLDAITAPAGNGP